MNNVIEKQQQYTVIIISASSSRGKCVCVCVCVCVAFLPEKLARNYSIYNILFVSLYYFYTNLENENEKQVL